MGESLTVIAREHKQKRGNLAFMLVVRVCKLLVILRGLPRIAFSDSRNDGVGLDSCLFV